VGLTFTGSAPDLGAFETDVTAIERNSIDEKSFVLNQNYPNPFNPSTKISYQITYPGFINLTIYDVLGNKVATIVNQYQSSGQYAVSFNAKAYPSGMYLYSLRCGNNFLTKKMMLLK